MVSVQISMVASLIRLIPGDQYIAPHWWHYTVHYSLHDTWSDCGKKSQINSWKTVWGNLIRLSG